MLLLQLKNDTAKVVSATISETCVNFIDSDRYFIFVLLFFFLFKFLEKRNSDKKIKPALYEIPTLMYEMKILNLFATPNDEIYHLGKLLFHRSGLISSPLFVDCPPH